MNKCGFIGRLGQDVTFYPAQGQGQGAKKAFCTFSLGITRPGGWKDAAGKPITDWLEFTANGKTAELIQQYAGTKGLMLAIVDCVAVKESFKDKQGNDRTAVKFSVKDIDLGVTFASNPNGNNGGNNNGVSQGTSNNSNNYNAPANNGYNAPANNGGTYNANSGNNFAQGRQPAPPQAPYAPSIQDDGNLPF